MTSNRPATWGSGTNPDPFPAARGKPAGRSDRRTRVLMELRPCFDGYAGIPQETRLLFGAFAASSDFLMGGLLNGAASNAGARADTASDPALRVFSQAGHLIALDNGHTPASLLRRIGNRTIGSYTAERLSVLRRAREIDGLGTTLDPEVFGDWIWMRLMRLGLEPEQRALIERGKFIFPRMSWGDAARLATLNSRARTTLDMAASGWDIHLAHTPSPYRLRGGKLVVRYHDAIPLLWPHTISHAWQHARSHYRMLKANIADGAWFVCTSEPVRDDLLRLFPKAEKRSIVIPTMSSGAFRPEPRPAAQIQSIIKRGRDAGASKLRALPSAKTDSLPGASAKVDNQPFIMAVSTLEPRKNYEMLMRAAAVAHRRRDGGFHLVMVANPGWRSEREVALLRQLVNENIVYHLSDVSTHDLRALYTAAHAVICPSRAEGFDLATVEAMACGAPVFASDIPVHRWVCGDAVEYFDPYDEDRLSNLISEVVSAPRKEGRLADLADQGLRRAGLYAPSVLEPAWHNAMDQVARA
ncbi:glycosyltransferase [Tanticharoenia sakaeratensis NBRC 103193]|nr:glycosyltransferase [Tanticharoenia sakaeratensis NBRC 103193]